MKTIATTLTALTMTLGMSSGSTRAADYHTVDQLAYSLMQQTSAATREVRLGFRNSPQYRHLYQDVYDMHVAASHIHDVAHDAGSRQHILDDVQQLDELVHHIEELIDEMGGGGIHGHHGHYRGHSSDYHVRRLRLMVAGIADTVHELQDVVGFSRPSGPVLYGRPAVGRPVIVPPSQFVVPRNPYDSYRNGGFQIRRGANGRVSFSVRIP